MRGMETRMEGGEGCYSGFPFAILKIDLMMYGKFTHDELEYSLLHVHLLYAHSDSVFLRQFF